MEFTNAIYTENEKLVRKITYNVSQKHGLDPEELIGDAFEIFVKAVQKFDDSKDVQFTTWLHWQLLHLNTCALRARGLPQQKENTEKYYTEELFECAVYSIDFSYQTTELLHDIAMQLSSNSQMYLKDLLTGHFLKPISKKGGRPQKFPLEVICNKYNWTRKEALSVRNEITNWWNTYKVS